MIVGADTSTTRSALVKLTPTGALVDTRVLEPAGRYALDRVVTVQDLIPEPAWWDGVTCLVIEQQIPSRGTTGYWEQVLVAGAVVRAAVLAGADVLPLTPSAWRKTLGWPRMSSAEAKTHALRTQQTASIDEAEAWCIARAGLLILNQTEAA